MRLGVQLGYWGLLMDRDQQLAATLLAEELGYDSVWTAEAYGSDAATILAWLAAQTSRIRLGAAVLQIPGRSAAMTAMTAATIDNLSDGRMILGLGTSGPQVSEGWHGVRFARQLARTRDYVEVVRLALARERVSYSGETLTLPLPDGPGKALKLIITPVQERIPIYLAALGPKNTQLAGEIADGWIPTFMSPEHMGEFRSLIAQGAARVGRDPAAVEIAPSVQVHISDDVATARDHMRPGLALYIGGMGSRQQNFYKTLAESYGFADAAATVQDLYLEGRREEAARALPAELIDLVSLCGPPSAVAERLEAFRAAGVGTLLATPVALGAEAQAAQLRALAELAL
ncbi:MAG TPA: LLM class F420-dependent oxidoreductase [Solirubrobacteraceae bacterium]|nr:LLM class F420-dependent oxidoreductase [Solirubrobacteraceae bacterium]